jgi:hypothetical protein
MSGQTSLAVCGRKAPLQRNGSDEGSRVIFCQELVALKRRRSLWKMEVDRLAD